MNTVEPMWLEGIAQLSDFYHLTVIIIRMALEDTILHVVDNLLTAL